LTSLTIEVAPAVHSSAVARGLIAVGVEAQAETMLSPPLADSTSALGAPTPW
jgi:hypothetical protein